MSILNLTMHPASAPQITAGVVEPDDKQAIKDLLLFVGMPSMELVQERAQALADLAVEAGVEAAMIGGAPFLMAPLHAALEQKGLRPLYAFSERVSEEVVQEDGSTRKVNKFVHLGFVG